MTTNRFRAACCIFMLSGAVACSDQSEPAPYGLQAQSPPAVVDSAIPLPEAIRRFQESNDGPVPLTLEGAPATMDELMRILVDAYRNRDPEALDRLTLSRAEFGYLYYPESPYPEPPYEIAPELLWFMVEQNSAKGASAAAAYFEQRDATYIGHDCSQARTEGANLLWGPCFVTLRWHDGREDVQRIANAIVQREGRFKLVGLDNEL